MFPPEIILLISNAKKVAVLTNMLPGFFKIPFPIISFICHCVGPLKLKSLVFLLKKNYVTEILSMKC